MSTGLRVPIRGPLLKSLDVEVQTEVDVLSRLEVGLYTI